MDKRIRRFKKARISNRKFEINSEHIRNEKKQWEAIIENMSDGVFVVDKHNNLTLLNQAARDFFYMSEDIKKSGDSHRHTRYYDMNDNELFIEDMAGPRVLNGEKIKAQRIKVKRPDKTVYFSISGSPIYDSEGNVSAAIVCSRDITGYIKSEELIKLQKEQLETIIENISDSIMIADKNSNILIMNKEAKNQIYKADQFKSLGDANSTTIYKDVEGKQIPCEKMPLQRALNGEKVVNDLVYVKRPDRDLIVEASSIPIFDQQGNINLAIGISHDITELIQNEKLIIQQKEELDAIIQSMADGIVLVDKHYKVNFLNDAATRFFNKADKINELRDTGKYNRFFYDIDGEAISFGDSPSERVFKNGRYNDYRVTIEQPDQKIYASINGAPIYYEFGEIRAAILCFRDITEQVKKNELIKQQQISVIKAEKEKNEILIKAINTKDEFVSLISHEFKTPVNIIISAIQTMELIYKDDITEKIKRYLDKIKQNTYRQLRLINNLLDITSINAGFIKLNKKNMDIVFLAKSITESVLLYAQQKQINVIFSSEITEKYIGIDDEKFERILLNLLSNAIKYTPREGEIYVRVSMSSSSTKEMICIEVEDTGVGIPENKQKLIFERFGQVDSSFTRQAEGLGLGLYLVKLFVDALDGEVFLESDVEKGSRFKVFLPCNMVEEPDKNKQNVLQNNRIVNHVAIEFSDVYL